MTKIIHYADVQVQNREKRLEKPYAATLKEIEKTIAASKAEIVIIAGDFFEYNKPNDSERKLIYNHLSRIANIATVKEIVIMDGNHDIEDVRKQTETTAGHTALSVFTDMLAAMDENKRSKFLYLTESKIYRSKVANIDYYAYSLLDNKYAESDFVFEYVDATLTDIGNKKICVFHAMIKEYVDFAKLPIRKDKYEALYSVEQFPKDSLVIAGDIHVPFSSLGSQNQTFHYSGSTTQHTFNEGTYLYINDEGTKEHLAHNKHILLHHLQDDGAVSTEPLGIANNIEHYKIHLECSSIEKVLEALTAYPFDFTTYKLDIEVVSTVGLMEHEKTIYQHLYHIIVENENCNFTQYSIIFDYPKVVVSTSVSNPIIAEIMNERIALNEAVSDDASDDNKVTHIDDLLLTRPQLEKMFRSVVTESVNKNIGDTPITKDVIVDDIMSIFKNELTNNMSDAKRYDIELLNVETNGFMALGQNKIRLNIPGLVRILSANGIGKTTMYRMLRWVITEEAFDGMAKNKVKENNYLVFNKNRADVDVVDVTLNIMVNGAKVKARRVVERKWKNNVSDKQKQASTWRNAVAGLERSFSLEITTRTGEVKTLSGEEAQRAMNTWFGDTIETILFVNQTKIENMLRMDSGKLNDLVLNFIGVDYLQKLEDSLDGVKTELLSSVAKPKETKDELLTKQKEIEASIATKTEQKNDLIGEQKAREETQNELVAALAKSQKNLLDLGNIPSLIASKETEIATLEADITALQSLDTTEKAKIAFTEVEPKKDEAALLVLTQAHAELKAKEQESVNVMMEHNNKIVGIIAETKKAIELHNNTLTDEKDKFVIVKTTWQSDIDTEYNNITNYIDTTIKKFETLRDDNSRLITEAQTNIDNMKKTITTNNEQIVNGVCDKCKRAFTDDYEGHKAQLEKENVELLRSVELANSGIVDNKATLDKALGYIATFNALRDMSIAKNREGLAVDVLKKGCGEFLTNIDTCLQHIVNVDNKIADIDKDVRRYEMFYMFLDTYKNNGTSETFTNELISSFIPNIALCVTSLKNVLIERETYQNNTLKELFVAIAKNEKDQNELIAQYNDALAKYNTLLLANVKSNEEIDTFNKAIATNTQNLHNKRYSLLMLQTATNQLRTEKLPLYTSYSTQCLVDENAIVEGKKIIDEIRTNIHTLEIEVNNLNNELLQVVATYEACIQFQKNNLMYKIYSSLVKNDFKDLVFEYYRTFLNSTLNILLSDVSFKLFWDNNSELIHVENKHGVTTYQSVQQSSGMETCFLGLALIYTMHLLNVKNKVSHIFIDELSGTLNEGVGLSYDANNYKELFVQILGKFTDKTLFIIDHSVDNLYETKTYEVAPSVEGSIYSML